MAASVTLASGVQDASTCFTYAAYATSNSPRCLSSAVLCRYLQIEAHLVHANLQAHVQALEASIIDHNIKLVLVDSIAALARSEFSRDKVTDRQQVLGKSPAEGCLHF